ncbi:MAG: ATP-binding cassette domain-containing protein [Candidatus Cloacimonetes bacterium]|nr:ATP-binding cassette domain-containing protein [Candidatus Cloacimonadota bacterium]
MIELVDVTVGFDGKPVLRNISCTFPEGRTTLVVGASGSGKSVLMRTIEGLIRPVSGEVWIDGERIDTHNALHLRQTRRKLSMLFQGAALLDSMNVYQNVALPLVEHTRLEPQEIRRQVREKLALVGLHNVEEAMPSALSGGMRKRVGLARAIILEPRYIIYDEPTTGLDPVIAEEIVRLIQKLRDSLEVTTIVVTHDLECIDRLAERVVMIGEEVKWFEGDYQEFTRSDDKHIRAFLYGYGGRSEPAAGTDSD